MPPDHSFDLHAYFARIGYDGPTAPSSETLAAIHKSHTFSIVFENLDVLLGRGVSLDLPVLQRKLVHDRRGGYCFEQNTLFAAALKSLGFSVAPMLARVRWQVPAEVTTPRSHMVLQVEAGGESWLADVGFGGTGLITPVKLDTAEPQHEDFEPRRLIRQGGEILHQTLIGDAWQDVYRFAVEEAFPVDFQVANWFTSTHPSSRFRQNLIVAQVGEKGRVTLFDRELTIRGRDGNSSKRSIGSNDELLDVLSDYFELHFPSETRIHCPAWA